MNETQYNLTRSRLNQRDILTRRKFGFVDYGPKVFSVGVGGDIQKAINSANTAGGGVVQLGIGTYNLTASLIPQSNVSIFGQGTGTILDFGNGAFGINVLGSGNYSTGTVTIANDATTVSGALTVWTSAMVGQSILLGDLWYEITGFTNGTTITIGSPYSGTALAGAAYMIATTIDGVTLSNFTVQSSSASLVKLQYADASIVDSITCSSGSIGIDIDDSSSIQILNGFITACTSGVTIDKTPFFTWSNTSIDSCTGKGLAVNTTNNSAFSVWSIQNCGAGAMTLQSVTNTGFENFSIDQTTGIGLELISGNSSTTFVDGFVSNSSSDGIKLTATSDNNSFSLVDVIGSGGWGINIANANCDNNILGLMYAASNTSGNLTNSGTGTINSGNSGF